MNYDCIVSVIGVVTIPGKFETTYKYLLQVVIQMRVYHICKKYMGFTNNIRQHYKVTSINMKISKTIL